MEHIEFYIIDNELWMKSSSGNNKLVDINQTELINFLLDYIQSFYPQAYTALTKIYNRSSKNLRFYRYKMVRRFCACNFCKLDITKCDIENTTGECKFNFEVVECPIRGECLFEGVVCKPKFREAFSHAEERVMRLYYEGKNKEEIARCLYLSPFTVKNHIKSSYAKIGVHDKSAFIKYANIHNLFT